MPHPDNYSPEFAPDGFVSAAEEAWEDRTSAIEQGIANLRKDTTTDAISRIVGQVYGAFDELTGDQAQAVREAIREAVEGCLDTLAADLEVEVL